MAALGLKMAISLDGYVEPAHEDPEWIAAGGSPDRGAWLLDTVSNAGAHLMGAETYKRWATSGRRNPGRSGGMSDIPKVVFSNSLTSADWRDTTIATGDLTEAVTRLKQEHSGGYLLAQAGVRFARSLVETGLINDYRQVVHPIVLGAGERLFTAPLPSNR